MIQWRQNVTAIISDDNCLPEITDWVFLAPRENASARTQPENKGAGWWRSFFCFFYNSLKKSFGGGRFIVWRLPYPGGARKRPSLPMCNSAHPVRPVCYLEHTSLWQLMLSMTILSTAVQLTCVSCKSWSRISKY